MQWNPRGYPREMVADPVLFIEQKKSEACIARYGTTLGVAHNGDRFLGIIKEAR